MIVNFMSTPSFPPLATDWQALHSTLNTLNLIGITLSNDFVIQEVSPYLLRKTGWQREELIARPLLDVVKQQERPYVEELLQTALHKSGKISRKEIELLAANGSVRTVMVNTVLYQENATEVEAFTIVGEDISHRIRMESALAKSNTQLQDLVDNTTDLIQLITLDGRFVFVNKAWRDKLGYGPDALTSLTLNDLIEPSRREATQAQLLRVQQGEIIPDFETVFLTQEGRQIYLTGSVNCRFDHGKPTAYRCIFHDYTEKYRAERAQNLYYAISNWTISTQHLDDLYQRIHEELGKIIDVRNFFIALYDQNKSYLSFPYYVDEYFQGNMKFTKRRLGNGLTEYAIASNKPLFLYDTDIQELAQTKSLYLYGQTPKVLLCVPLRIGERVTGIIGVKSYDKANIYDERDLQLLEFISGQVALAIERKQSEEELANYAARLNAIFESSSHLIWSVNKSLQLTSFNQNYADLVKTQLHISPSLYVSTEKLGWRMVSPESKRTLQQKYKQAFRGEAQYFELMIPAPDSSEMWLELYLNPIVLSSGSIEEVSGIARDITKRKQAQLALRESEQMFRGIFENLQDIYFRVDRKGHITMISPSVLKRTGYTPQEVLGRPIVDFFDDKRKIHSALIRLRKDKSLRNFEIGLRAKDGTERTFMFNMLLFADERGRSTEVAALARDITEIKRNEQELRKAKEQAELSLKAKESFLANMSHEIRTPMNGVIGMIDLLVSTPLNQEQFDYVTTIKRSSETLLNILNDILDLSKIEAGKMVLHPAPFALRELLDKIVSLFIQTARNKNTQLSYQLAEGLPPYLIGDQTRLLQILSNLTSNAIKFTENGSVQLRVALVRQQGSRVVLRVEVQDSGIGISAEDQAKLFTSFTQVDNSSQKSFGGTGLGLAISKQLCRLMKGEIGVTSTKGQGSTFWFTFEAEVSEVAPRSAADEAKEIAIEQVLAERKLRILLVDDNLVNRKVASEILRKSGCEVVQAESGFVALEQVAAAQAEQRPFQLILMDIQMPDMDGIETTRRLRERWPEGLPPVVAMTAYSMKEDRERFLAQGMDDYLSKPIRASLLIEKVQERTAALPQTPPPPTPESDRSPVWDRDILRQLQAIGGAELVQAVLDDFVAEASVLVAEAAEAFARQDIALVKSHLHTLKGSAGTVGVVEVAEIARQAEGRLKEGDASQLEQALQQLQQAYQRFQEAYRRGIPA